MIRDNQIGGTRFIDKASVLAKPNNVTQCSFAGFELSLNK